MRILPLLAYTLDKPIADRYQLTKQVSALTHGHARSVIACFYYLEFARQILQGTDKFMAYENLKAELPEYLNSLTINPEEISVFSRLLIGTIHELSADEIQSSGYVLHTLEASIWCLLTTESYKKTTLKAIN